MSMIKPAAQTAAVLSIAGLLLHGSTATAQDPTPACKPEQVIPLTATEPAAKLVVGVPSPEPLASRGVVVIPFCTENMRIAKVFGPNALDVSPRVGHLHVTVDNAPWHWADAGGSPVILQGLAPGAHEVLIELANANHQIVDKGTIRFEIPARNR